MLTTLLLVLSIILISPGHPSCIQLLWQFKHSTFLQVNTMVLKNVQVTFTFMSQHLCKCMNRFTDFVAPFIIALNQEIIIDDDFQVCTTPRCTTRGISSTCTYVRSVHPISVHTVYTTTTQKDAIGNRQPSLSPSSFHCTSYHGVTDI